jgi:hypothetical protein
MTQVWCSPEISGARFTDFCVAQENRLRFLLTFPESIRNILDSYIAYARCWGNENLGQEGSRFKGEFQQGGNTMATKKKATKKAAKKKKR